MKQKYWELPIDCHLWRDSSSHISLELEEIGLYFHLMIYQWVADSVPDDVREIAAVVSKPVGKVRRAGRGVKPKFPLCDDGKRRNERVEEIRAIKDAKRKKLSEAGRKGGRKRLSQDQAQDQAQDDTLLKPGLSNDSIVTRSIVHSSGSKPTNNRDSSTGGGWSESQNQAAFNEFRND